MTHPLKAALFHGGSYIELPVHEHALARVLQQLQREEQIIEMVPTYTQFRIVVSFLFQNANDP